MRRFHLASEGDLVTVFGAVVWPGRRIDDDFVAFSDPNILGAPIRVLVLADKHGATQEISFLQALGRLRATSSAAVRVIDESNLADLRAAHGEVSVASFLRSQVEQCRPAAIVLSRYSGPDHLLIFALAREYAIPTICHLDDNLFEPPAMIGLDIWRRLAAPDRLHALYDIVGASDLVFASTPDLAGKISARMKPRHVVAGRIYVGGEADLEPAQPLLGIPAKAPGEIRIGYMGSGSHVADLDMIRPAIGRIMRRFPGTTFQLFGSIANSSISRAFDRITLIKRVRGGYAEFRKALNALQWDIGLAPLRPMSFNDSKAPTKCIEYFEAGFASVASDSVPYRPLGARGAVMLAGPADWEEALAGLVMDRNRRAELVAAGYQALRDEYNWPRLERQLLDVLWQAKVISGHGAPLRKV